MAVKGGQMNAKDGARKIVDDFLVRHSTPHMRSRFRAAIDAEIAHAVAEARAPLVEALRAVEWVRHGCEYEKNSWCPACDTEEHYGHAPDCPLAAALAKETPDA